jgi:hypothetical protein
MVGLEHLKATVRRVLAEGLVVRLKVLLLDQV